MTTQARLIKSDGTELSPLVGSDGSSYIFEDDYAHLHIRNNIDGVAVYDENGGSVYVNNSAYEEDASGIIGDTFIGNSTGELNLYGSSVKINGEEFKATADEALTDTEIKEACDAA